MPKPILAVFFFLLQSLHSQPATFEVASVKLSEITTSFKEPPREVIEFTPAALTMRNVTMRSAIEWAYDVRDFQIAGTTALPSNRYDIAAKAAGPVPTERLRLMLQALLAERFKLALHRETKELAVYALRTVNRETKLRPAASDAPATMRPNGGALEFHNMSMAEFADRLPARPFSFDRPVIDKTGLTGKFDFSTKLADGIVELKREMERRELEQDTSIFTAPLHELGLRLQPEKGNVEMLVIDRLEKLPVAN